MATFQGKSTRDSASSPPKQKTQPEPGERQRFLASLKGAVKTADKKREAATGRVQTRRLTRSQFERSVQELRHIDMPFQANLPEYPLNDGFTTVAKGQQVSANQLETHYMPVVLAGGGFKHGQHLAFDRKDNYPLPNLFVSILQRMGMPIEKFVTSTSTMRGLEMS